LTAGPDAVLGGAKPGDWWLISQERAG
jgi:hypothetical protein